MLKLSSRFSALIAVLLLGGCQSTQTVVPNEIEPVNLTANVPLHLPASPGDLPAWSATQTLIARHDGKTQAMNAILQIAPENVYVLLTAANGPRIMEIRWNESGIDETRYTFTPDGLSGLNILADIFIAFWPIDNVVAALAPAADFNVVSGVRIISADGKVVMTVTENDVEDPNTKRHQTLHNLDRNYTLDIYSTFKVTDPAGTVSEKSDAE